jgi:chemotaxis protein MotB
MTKSNPKEVKVGAPAWMSTFSDLMTQILVFFVFLFTMSSLDIIKARTALVSFSAAFGGYSTLQNSAAFKHQLMIPYPETSPDRMQGSQGDDLSTAKLKEKLHEILFIVKANSIEEGIQGRYTDQGNLEITFTEELLFESGSASLKAESFTLLEKIGNALTDIENEIIVEGHTDNLPLSPRTGFQSNWELSSARALTVAKLFTEKSRIHPRRISIAGYGEHKPIVDNTTAKNRAINRRVAVIVVKELEDRVY